MSESMEKSRRATSGWQRTSLAAFSALFAFILARLSVRRRAALPAHSRGAQGILTTRHADADDPLDSHIRLRAPITMASAPSDFTQKVLVRIAASPAPQPVVYATRARVSWRRSFRVLGGTVSLALILMLATGVLVTLINPNLAVAILDMAISLAIGLLAFARTVAQLVSRASATPWVIPATLGGLLGVLLLSWAQVVRQFGRDPQ